MNGVTTKSLAEILDVSEVSVRKKLRVYEIVVGRKLDRTLEGAICIPGDVADVLRRASTVFKADDSFEYRSFEDALRFVLGLQRQVSSGHSGIPGDVAILTAEFDLLRAEVQRLQRQLGSLQQRQDLMDRQHTELIKICHDALSWAARH